MFQRPEFSRTTGMPSVARELDAVGSCGPRPSCAVRGIGVETKSWWMESITQVEAVAGRPARSQPAHVGRRLVRHLAVQDFDAVEAEPGRMRR